MTTFCFSLPIWRIFYDESPTVDTQSLLVLELRTQHQVQWCLVDTQQERVIWQQGFAEADWWTSAVKLQQGKLILHHYDNPEQLMPQKKSMIDVTVPQPSLENIVTELFLPSTSAWHTSITHTPESPYYQILCSFIEKTVGVKPIFDINYSEMFGNILAVHYFYHSNAFTLSRSILVINSSKTNLLHQMIDENAEENAFDEYIYDEKCIVCLRKQYELVILKWLKP